MNIGNDIFFQNAIHKSDENEAVEDVIFFLTEFLQEELDICEFMKYAKELGYEEQSMTTNGFFLEKRAEDLKDSGISRI